MSKFFVIDLFAGAGGLSLGLEQAGFDVVLANEFNLDACDTYKTNHPKTKLVSADIRGFDFALELKKINFYGKINLIAGGPPCQGFSTIGKKNEDDVRNQLFSEYIKVVEAISPDFVLFENVSGFKTMYKGKMFSLLINEFRRLGYSMVDKVLNAVNFGLPQSRKRVIIIGYKQGLSFSMPVGMYAAEQQSDQVDSDYRTALLDPKTLRDAISDLPDLESGEASSEYRTLPQNSYQRSLRGNEAVLTEHFAPRHGKFLLNVLRNVPYGGSIINVPVELRPKGYFSNTYGRLKWEEPTSTMTSNFGTPSSNRCVHPTSNRGLTTREGARLQSFPDSYVFSGKKGAKNLQIGNAVPPILGYEIGRQIIKSLSEEAGFYRSDLQ